MVFIVRMVEGISVGVCRIEVNKVDREFREGRIIKMKVECVLEKKKW